MAVVNHELHFCPAMGARWVRRPAIEFAGLICPYCDEGFEPEDHVALLPGVPEQWHWHWECLMRSLIGSVGHQKHLCSCHGGTEEDPPGSSRREAARAALRYFEDKPK